MRGRLEVESGYWMKTGAFCQNGPCNVCGRPETTPRFPQDCCQIIASNNQFGDGIEQRMASGINLATLLRLAQPYSAGFPHAFCFWCLQHREDCIVLQFGFLSYLWPFHCSFNIDHCIRVSAEMMDQPYIYILSFLFWEPIKMLLNHL